MCGSHETTGPAESGSSSVLVNDRQAVRLGDGGSYGGPCNSSWIAAKGSNSVLINGRPAHRQGDLTQSCGSSGTMVEGSGNVLIGTESQGVGRRANTKPTLRFRVLLGCGEPLSDAVFRILDLDGKSVVEGRLGSDGCCELNDLDWGAYQVELENGHVIELTTLEK